MEPSTSSHPNFYHFLNRMRQPAAADLVRSIKSFIVSFSFQTSNAEDDGKRVQDFLTTMETTIKEHPLWAHAAYEEIDSAIEGLEKYIMTKLFNHTFASSSEDVKLDLEILEKIRLLQHFIKPEHLDVPKALRNEASWLFAAKELQKINAFKAPRDKILCVMNCCRIINNLLLDISMTTSHRPAGADDFLPILIYVTIKVRRLSFFPSGYISLGTSTKNSLVFGPKANPPQLHSNLKFVQLFRKQSKLVSEVEYYLTNLISAKTFITSINASSLSMDENEFHKNMQLATLANEVTVNEPSGTVQFSEGNTPTMRRHGKEMNVEGYRYPFMDAEAADLRFEDVQKLLALYKHVVAKYRLLSEALSQLSVDEHQLLRALKDPQSVDAPYKKNPTTD